jgi:hypothetical protein
MKGESLLPLLTRAKSLRGYTTDTVFPSVFLGEFVATIKQFAGRF